MLVRLLLMVSLSLTGACSAYFFYPMKTLVRTPADLKLSYEDVHFTTRDALQLHGWLLHAPQPRGVVLFLHGNAENISTHIGSVYWLPAAGYEVLLLDYRGYGHSQGQPDFPQVYDDVDAAYRWLQGYADRQRLPMFILAQSIGAAIGSYYFAQLPRTDVHYQAIALDAVFAGQRDIARDVLGRHWLTWPFQFIVPPLLPAEYDPQSHVSRLSPTPLLFFHSPDDPVIPYTQGKQVYQQALAPKTWVRTAGPHIATFNDPANRETLLEFFARNGALTPSATPRTD